MFMKMLILALWILISLINISSAMSGWYSGTVYCDERPIKDGWVKLWDFDDDDDDECSEEAEIGSDGYFLLKWDCGDSGTEPVEIYAEIGGVCEEQAFSKPVVHDEQVFFYTHWYHFADEEEGYLGGYEDEIVKLIECKASIFTACCGQLQGIDIFSDKYKFDNCYRNYI